MTETLETLIDRSFNTGRVKPASFRRPSEEASILPFERVTGDLPSPHTALTRIGADGLAHDSWDSNIDQYSEHLKAKGQAYRTVKEVRYPLNTFKTFCLRSNVTDLEDVTEECVLTFVRAELDRIKPSTAAFKVNVLRQFFGYLKREKLIDTDPCLFIQPPRASKPLPKDILSQEDFLKLVRAIDTSCIYGFVYRTIIEVLYGTGIRMGELVHLKVGDLNLKDCEVRIHASKTLKERVLPLNEVSIKYLKAYLKKVRPLIMNFSKSTLDHVFVNMYGRIFDPRRINAKIKSYTKVCGLDKSLRAHNFRYAYASHLYENGADIRIIQELLGHRSLTMTAKYILLSKKALVDTLKKHHPRERGKL